MVTEGDLTREVSTPSSRRVPCRGAGPPNPRQPLNRSCLIHAIGKETSASREAGPTRSSHGDCFPESGHQGCLSLPCPAARAGLAPGPRATPLGCLRHGGSESSRVAQRRQRWCRVGTAGRGRGRGRAPAHPPTLPPSPQSRRGSTRAPLPATQSAVLGTDSRALLARVSEAPCPWAAGWGAHGVSAWPQCPCRVPAPAEHSPCGALSVGPGGPVCWGAGASRGSWVWPPGALAGTPGESEREQARPAAHPHCRPGGGQCRGGRGSGLCSRGPAAPQVLEPPAQPGGVAAQLHEVHRQPPVPALPVHRGLRPAGHAVVRGAVRGPWGWAAGRGQLCAEASTQSAACMQPVAGAGAGAGCSWLLAGLPLPQARAFLRFNFQDETPTTNFDTFPAAILTVFQVRPLSCSS